MLPPCLWRSKVGDLLLWTPVIYLGCWLKGLWVKGNQNTRTWEDEWAPGWSPVTARGYLLLSP